MANLPTSDRPGACVLYGVRLSWRDEAEAINIQRLIPMISREYDGQYDNPLEFIEDASMGIKLKGGPYFLWQPNNDTASQNYIVLSYSIVLADEEKEYK